MSCLLQQELNTIMWIWGPAPRVHVCVCASVMSGSFQLHGLWPTRLLCPWDFSGQEYWSGLLFPPPGLLPNQRSNPSHLHVLHRQADSSIPLAPPGNTSRALMTVASPPFPTPSPPPVCTYHWGRRGWSPTSTTSQTVTTEGK